MIGALRRAFGAACLIGAVMSASGAQSETNFSLLDFSQLDGWETDDHAAALDVFSQTCMDFDDPDWRSLCAVAKQQEPTSARAFFELLFRPVLIQDGQAALCTGYFEPELDGSRYRSARFQYPIYKMPPEAR